MPASKAARLPLALLIGTELSKMASGITLSSFAPHGSPGLDDACKLGLMPNVIAVELPSLQEGLAERLGSAMRRFRCPALAIVPDGDVSAAAAALRCGAADAIQMPKDPALLSAALEDMLPAKSASLADDGQRSSLGAIIGVAPCMQELYRVILSVSASNATVFIQGPSGTGKELVAKEVHSHSPRARGPFVAVNCGAIPPSLLESELFGHERGAFTGAVARHQGKFEQADGGTLFLDEVTELPLDLQVKLLRALQEMSVSRVGGKELIPVDLRIVCASNRDIKEWLEKRLLREDLYYRLNVVPVRTPPLSERSHDIPLLLEHFLRVFSGKYRKDFKGFSNKAMDRLVSYSWPGNVREMENMVERMVVLNDGPMVDESSIPEELREAHRRRSAEQGRPHAEGRDESFDGTLDDRWLKEPPILPPMPLRKVEIETIKSALLDAHGNAAKAARTLQIETRSLYRKLKRVSLKPKDFKNV